MSGFVTAARYLTVVPLPGRVPGDPGALGRSAGWFPVVGTVLGAVLAVGDRGFSTLFPPILAALLTLTAWKLLTGGLHLDGLADSLDGLMGRDRDHRLRIMRDSRIGVFAAVGLIFVLLLELLALAELPAETRWRALLAAPAVGRAAPPLLAVLFGAARSDGQGALFAGGVRPSGSALAAVSALVVSLVLLGATGAAAFGIGLAAVVAVGGFLSGRLGGLTGDGLGAAVEIGELAVLLTLVSWNHLGLP